jgi:uncharacterized membrane protein
MIDRLRFLYNRIRERLWVRPLAMVIFSIALVFVARLADSIPLPNYVPDISVETIDSLLTIMASSMLVIATFSVASMVSAYASASNTATPRSFALVLADDVSQNALSTFIGAFIFSIVALTASKNSIYDLGGRFALFCMTLIFFLIVILTFVRWVDRIARLGRLGNTIQNVESTVLKVFERRKNHPYLEATRLEEPPENGLEIYPDCVGYIQRIDIAALQEFAEEFDLTLSIVVLPGTFVTPERALVHVSSDENPMKSVERQPRLQAFRIGDCRTFDEDPRFGLIVLSEIASRALSPGINDPGTAIDVLGRMVRLFLLWGRPTDKKEEEPKYNRVAVYGLELEDLFDDAFPAIARDGAGIVEVAIRLQKALKSLADSDEGQLAKIAKQHSRLALARASEALTLSNDLQALQAVAEFSKSP